MELVILPQHWTAVVAIALIIGTFIAAYLKKIMISYALVIANLIVFFFSVFFTYELIYGFSVGLPFAGLGFRPMYLTLEMIPQWYTLFTSMFIHGDFAHILGNMLVFFFIGTAFEQRIGKKKMILIYLLTGVCGALSHSIYALGIGGDSSITLIGASGAIFGIMGAFAYSYPWDEVVMPIPLGFIMIFRKVKVLYAVILFAVFETVLVWWTSGGGGQDNTAHLAHLGGLVSGIILAAVFIGRQEKIRKSTQTIYYDSFVQPKVQKIDMSKLKNLATTPELKEMLNRIEQETLPQVRDVWVEHFFEKARCPKCDSQLNHFDKKLWCENCGFRTKY